MATKSTTKSVMGRPKKKAANRRSVIVQFRCTAEEKIDLEKAARKEGQKLSDYLRQRALQA